MNIGTHGGSCGHSCCLRIQDLSVQIGKDAILRDVNMHLHCGQIVALIGPNGAGKSTLLKAVLGEREFDGVIYGTIIPNMLVVAKSDWISNPHLNSFTEKLFPIVSLIRKDGSSGMNVLRKCVAHLKKTQDSAVTIFVQQTIVDIDITTPEDIASGAYYIAQKACRCEIHRHLLLPF